MLKTCHTAKFLEASSLISRMPHVLKMTAREPQKLFLCSFDVSGLVSVSNGEHPVVLHYLGKQIFLVTKMLTDSTPSLSTATSSIARYPP